MAAGGGYIIDIQIFLVEKCHRLLEIKGFGHKFPNNLRVRAKNNFWGSFQGVRVKIENQDKTNMDFFPNSGTIGFRSNF